MRAIVAVKSWATSIVADVVDVQGRCAVDQQAE
jgi:hypothetical protein